MRDALYTILCSTDWREMERKHGRWYVVGYVAALWDAIEVTA